MKTSPQNTLAVHLARNLCEARCNYRRRLKRCRKKISAKAVHDLRVETRRLLALLDFLETARKDGSHDRLKKCLKKRLDAFDDLRDTHVQLQLLEPLWTEFPTAKPLKKILEKHEDKLIKKMRRKVGRMKPGGMLSKLKKLQKQICADADSNPQQNGRKVAGATLKKSFTSVVRLRRRIHGNDPTATHQMRVAFKRFRYMSDLLQAFLPRLTKERLLGMKKFQTSAGEIQDLQILLVRLDGFIREKKLPAIALRGLRDELSRRKHRALDAFMERIDDLLKFKPDNRADRRQQTDFIK